MSIKRKQASCVGEEQGFLEWGWKETFPVDPLKEEACTLATCFPFHEPMGPHCGMAPSDSGWPRPQFILVFP